MREKCRAIITWRYHPRRCGERERGRKPISSQHFEGRKMLRKEERDRRQLRGMASSRLSPQSVCPSVQSLSPTTWEAQGSHHSVYFHPPSREREICSLSVNQKNWRGRESPSSMTKVFSFSLCTAAPIGLSLSPLGAISSTFFLPI